MIESQRTESRNDIIHEEWANLTSQGSVLATCTSAVKGLHPHACLLWPFPAKGKKKRARPFPNLQCKRLLSCISSFSPCNWSTWEQMLSRYLWMDQVRSATRHGAELDPKANSVVCAITPEWLTIDSTYMALLLS